MSDDDILDDAPTKTWTRPTLAGPPPPRREADVLTADEVAALLRVDRKPSTTPPGAATCRTVASASAWSSAAPRC